MSECKSDEPAELRVWIPMADGGEVMIEVAEVATIVTRKVPGAWRDLPGGRREQGPASYDVVFRLRSGATDRMTLSEGSWQHVRALVRGEVAP